MSSGIPLWKDSVQLVSHLIFRQVVRTVHSRSEGRNLKQEDMCMYHF